jgi:hypothetical protein
LCKDTVSRENKRHGTAEELDQEERDVLVYGVQHLSELASRGEGEDRVSLPPDRQIVTDFALLRRNEEQN